MIARMANCRHFTCGGFFLFYPHRSQERLVASMNVKLASVSGTYVCSPLSKFILMIATEVWVYSLLVYYTMIIMKFWKYYHPVVHIP